MNALEKQISYATNNSYTTLNQLSEKTKNVWIVFHGIGYLSRYFISYFDALPKDENYIIAPQAPSKYYLNNAYKHVGASWLTKERTTASIENLLTYLDAIYLREAIPEHCKIIVLGFSQGVSVAMRWVAKSKIHCNQLVLYAGGIPKELVHDDFVFLAATTEVKVIVGDEDEYLTGEIMKSEKEKIKTLFPRQNQLINFSGKHEMKKEIINALL